MFCMYVSHQAFNFDQIEMVRSLHTCALVLRKVKSYFSTKLDQLRLQLYSRSSRKTFIIIEFSQAIEYEKSKSRTQTKSEQKTQRLN